MEGEAGSRARAPQAKGQGPPAGLYFPHANFTSSGKPRHPVREHEPLCTCCGPPFRVGPCRGREVESLTRVLLCQGPGSAAEAGWPSPAKRATLHAGDIHAGDMLGNARDRRRGAAEAGLFVGQARCWFRCKVHGQSLAMASSSSSSSTSHNGTHPIAAEPSPISTCSIRPSTDLWRQAAPKSRIQRLNLPSANTGSHQRRPHRLQSQQPERGITILGAECQPLTPSFPSPALPPPPKPSIKTKNSE